jgi:hypothetical protein
MDTQPSRPVTREKPIPVTNRQRVVGVIIASLIGLGLGLIGGIVAGAIGYLIGSAQYPGLEMGLLALLLGPIIVFPIAGLCTGFVTARQRSIERGAVVGAVTFGGSQLVLYISSITEFWMVVVAIVVVGAGVGASAGALAVMVSHSPSTHNHVTREAGK